jgi:hypothetical protein
VLVLEHNYSKTSDLAFGLTDGLNIPIGVLPVPGGALVYSIPNLYFMPEKDGVAAGKKVLYSQFGFKDTHGMTGEFVWGFDGWVYACHGFANTSTIKAADGSAITMQSGNTYRIKPDGTLGDAVSQPGKPDAGIYGHQVRTTPGNQTAILVSRGNNAAGGKAEDPGALKLYAFKDGALTNLASVAPGNGLGFGPRHLDFHPTQPWVFVSIERQNKLYVYQLQPDGALARDPTFIKDTLADPANEKPAQGAGPIHVHPNGRFVYVTNRNQGEVDADGKKVFNGGENNVAVFAIDEKTGEPKLIQTIEGHGIHLRTFGIDPSGKLLVATSIRPMPLRDGKTLTTGIMVYRIGGDGRLEFVRKYDVDTAKGQQFWSGMVTLG